MTTARFLLVFAVLLATAACLCGCLELEPGFACQSSDQCVSESEAGVCEPTGACSFTDKTCPSRRRYGERSAPDLRGTCVPPVIATDRTTTWSPGILEDTQLGKALGDDGLPQRATVCATLSPGQDIQQAVDSCPEGQVVQLEAGSFTVSSTITLRRGIVLRGAGSQGAPTGTTIVKTGGGTVLAIGDDRDAVCKDGEGHSLAQNGEKGSITIHVGSAAASFSAGSLALIDEVDTTPVKRGDCNYFKRDERSVSQRVEVKSVDAAQGTLTLASPLHWTFRAAAPHLAQITTLPATRPTTRWAGIERLRVQGGTNSGYLGEMAGGIDVSNAAYCWVKDVQTDDTIGGTHISLTATYRCVVRDSYLHHSADYGYGKDCTGIVLRCGAADNLVENNIVRYQNKPIIFSASGGGNVVGYNYVDNSWAEPPTWQEVNIDCHCAFPHMELVEGNYAPHIGATTTHGNAGYITFYRNHASSQFAAPAVFGSTAVQTDNVTAIQLQGTNIGMNVVGNVLGADSVSGVYEAYDNAEKAIYRFDGGSGSTDVVVTSLYRHGNYDFVNNTTRWDPANPFHTLLPSLYHLERPSWWPAGSAWPWAGPDLSPMVGTLPAKARSDKL